MKILMGFFSILLSILFTILFSCGYAWLFGKMSVLGFNYIFNTSFQLPFDLDRPETILILGLIGWYFWKDLEIAKW